jgi:hypothetical protein
MAGEIDPSQGLYLGECPGSLGEVYVDLAEVYGLPSSNFALSLSQYGDDERDLRLRLGSGDNRVATLSDNARELLKSKIIKYWTRT